MNNLPWYALAYIYYERPDKDEFFNKMCITVRDGSNNNFTSGSLLNCKEYRQFTSLSFSQVVNNTVDGKTHHKNIINFKSYSFPIEPSTYSDSSSNNSVISNNPVFSI